MHAIPRIGSTGRPTLPQPGQPILCTGGLGPPETIIRTSRPGNCSGKQTCRLQQNILAKASCPVPTEPPECVALATPTPRHTCIHIITGDHTTPIHVIVPSCLVCCMHDPSVPQATLRCTAVQGSRDMSSALTVCDSASNALAERSDMLASVANDLESGVVNLCIARGCIRSLQNALITLVKHSSLLLKDVMLRLDVWNDASVASMRRKVRSRPCSSSPSTCMCDAQGRRPSQHDTSRTPVTVCGTAHTGCPTDTCRPNPSDNGEACMRCVQVDERLHKLGAQQSRLGGVLTHLRDVEMRLGPPDTSAAMDTHTTISTLGEAATLLNEVLRNVDQSHAELPPLFVTGQDPTLQQLQQAQLPDVDRSTQVRCSAIPVRLCCASCCGGNILQRARMAVWALHLARFICSL